MKIVHLVLSLKPGGLESVVCSLAHTAPADRVETVVCCLDERGAFAERLGDDVTVDVVARRPGSDPGLVFRLAAYLRRVGADVVHTHSLDPMFYGAIAARLARVPRVIHTQHHTMLERASTADRLKFRVAARFCDAVVAVTAETARMARGCGAPMHRVVTIPNGVDCERFAPIPDRLQRRSREATAVRFGTVARLSPEKGLDVLLRAFAVVRRAAPDSELCIVGDGPARADLERLAADLDLALGVRFVGHQDRVERWFTRWDAFVLPSLTEGLPVALLEAMACALPVVATSVGGVPDVVAHGGAGLLVPPSNVDALASAMIELTVGSRRRVLGAASRQTVLARYSIETMRLAYRRLYVGDGPTSRGRELLKRQLRRLTPARLVMWAAAGAERRAALTFDDGPDPEFTPEILRILKEHGVRATFFLIGDKAARQPAIVDRILADGHEIANHSYTHPEFARLGWRGSWREINSTERALNVDGRQSQPMFRPPRGRLTVASLLAAWTRRLRVVLWSVDLKDFAATDQRHVLDRLQTRPLVPGDIVLYHGRSDASLAALPGVIDAARGAGLELVSVSMLGGAR